MCVHVCVCVCVCIAPEPEPFVGSWGHHRPLTTRCVCPKDKGLFSMPTKQIPKSETWTSGPSYYPTHSLCSHSINRSNGVHCSYFAASPEPTFLLSGTFTYSRLILCISCPSPRISHFSKESWFLLLENGIRNQDLSATCVWCP